MASEPIAYFASDRFVKRPSLTRKSGVRGFVVIKGVPRVGELDKFRSPW